MQPSSRDTNLDAVGTPAGQSSHAAGAGKLAWHTPMIEEVPFTRTESGGVGGVYDFAVYSGSH